MTFKKMPWVALLAVFALIVAACGGDDAADDTTTTEAAEVTTTTAAPEPEETTTTTEAAPAIELLVWADENRASAIEEVVPAFTEETGVVVNVELVDFGQIRDQVGVAGPAAWSGSGWQAGSRRSRRSGSRSSTE